MSGAQGVGTADYSRRTTGVEVCLDGLADDGGVEDAGGDSVDAENVTATAGDDVLVGDDAANPLRGDHPAGSDHLSKARAERALRGATGTDVLLGGDADDTLDERDGAPDKGQLPCWLRRHRPCRRRRCRETRLSAQRSPRLKC